MRAAFAARVSTDDQQDPTLSLPRQLAACQRALPEDMVVALHFYDVESGRTDLALRGRGTAHRQFDLPIPRDGGIDELLAEAKRPDRRFDVVICESVDRIARITYYGTKIEHELEMAGVLLLAADEGISMTRRRATNVLTRRMKQGIAEWYVLDMLEKSWGGFEVHTKQGWNVGRPPYGYLPDSIPHPVPARRAEGKHKTRLVPDPDRADNVRQIFRCRIDERLGYRVIAERLNLDPACHPVPVPTDPAPAVGRWTGSAVREILKNPKYTGHMVWNRRATKKGGKVNPVTTGCSRPSRPTRRSSAPRNSPPPTGCRTTANDLAAATLPTPTRPRSARTRCARSWSAPDAGAGCSARLAGVRSPTPASRPTPAALPGTRCPSSSPRWHSWTR